MTQTLTRTTRTFRKDLLYPELSYEIFGLLYKTHDELGRCAREKQYCDFIEKLLKEKGILYEREKEISKTGMDKNRADFVIAGKVLLEVKVVSFIGRREYYQVLRYLSFAKLRLAILVNFRQLYLKPKRVLNSSFK